MGPILKVSKWNSFHELWNVCFVYQKVITAEVAPITTFQVNSKVHMSSAGLVSCNARPPEWKKVQKNESKFQIVIWQQSCLFWQTKTMYDQNAVWWDAFHQFAHVTGVKWSFDSSSFNMRKSANSLIATTVWSDEAAAWPWNLTKPLINWV